MSTLEKKIIGTDTFTFVNRTNNSTTTLQASGTDALYLDGTARLAEGLFGATIDMSAIGAVTISSSALNITGHTEATTLKATSITTTDLDVTGEMTSPYIAVTDIDVTGTMDVSSDARFQKVTVTDLYVTSIQNKSPTVAGYAGFVKLYGAGDNFIRSGNVLNPSTLTFFNQGTSSKQTSIVLGDNVSITTTNGGNTTYDLVGGGTLLMRSVTGPVSLIGNTVTIESAGGVDINYLRSPSVYFTTAEMSKATAAALFVSGALTGLNANMTNITSTTLNTANGVFTNITTGSLNLTGINATIGTVTNLLTTNITGTTLNVTNVNGSVGTVANLLTTNITATALNVTNVNGSVGTITNLLATNISATALSLSGTLNQTNILATNITTSSLNVYGFLNAAGLRITGNNLESTATDTDVILNPNGTGNISLLANTGVVGDLTVIGNASTTNLTTGALKATSISSSNLTISGTIDNTLGTLSTGYFSVSNMQGQNAFAATGWFPTCTVSKLLVSNAEATNITTSALNVTNVLATNITTSTLNVTNAKSTNITSTNLNATSATITDLQLTNSNINVNLNVANSVLTTMMTTHGTITTLLNTNSVHTNITSATLLTTSPTIGILEGKTAQNISNATITEFTTHFTGGTNVTGGFISTSTNGRLSVAVAGKYSCMACICWNSGGSSNERWISFRVNGANFYGTNRNQTNLTASNTACVTLTLAAGDYVSLWCYQGSGGTITLDTTSGAFLSVTRVY